MQRDLVEAAGLEEYEWKDAKTFLDDLVEARRGDLTKGTLSETQHKRQVADALLAQKRRFQKNPELLTSQTKGAGAHTGATKGSGRSDDDKLLDPNTPIDEVNAILARRNGQ